MEIAEKFAPIGEEIDIKDAEVKVVLSKSNLKESISKETTPIQLAKLLPVLTKSLSNSIAIERHNNRYYYDTDTVFFDNLLGGYVDSSDFVPVRFGLKHGQTGKTTLYVVVDQNKIPLSLLEEKNKTKVAKTTAPLDMESSASRLVKYSIAQVVPFVNSRDVLRYIPDDMLTIEQRKTKWRAIADTIKKTNEKNDKKYAEYISEGQVDDLISLNQEKLKTFQKKAAKEAIVTIAEKLGLIKSEIDFDNAKVRVELSKSNLKESMSKDATPTQIAKLLPILSQTAKSAIHIERHSNRYFYDTDTVYFDNLLGAYVDGQSGLCLFVLD